MEVVPDPNEKQNPLASTVLKPVFDSQYITKAPPFDEPAGPCKPVGPVLPV